MKTIKLSFFLFICVVGFFQNSLADNLSVEKMIEQAKLKKLAGHTRWLQLGHYQKQFFDSNRYKSEVHSEEFFLSPAGLTDPEEELFATIRGFFLGKVALPDKHPQCQFRSRFLWLRSQLDWSKADLQLQICPGYEKWSHQGQIQSVSLIFATGYLGSPASYFGHPLLKFNLKNKFESISLLDVSLNYGALTPQNENPLVYAMKGLFGGYDGGFTHYIFFYNNHNYSETELRDMWEYELNLNSEQVEFIVSHTWELLGNKFTYYFLHDNCASRMGQMIEFALQDQILPRHVPYAIPYTIFDRLAEMKKVDGSLVVNKITRIPSRQSRLSEKYNFLQENEKKIIQNFIQDPDYINKEIFLKATSEKKIKILETLFDYYAFVEIKDKNKQKYQEIKRVLLFERLKQPPSVTSWGDIEQKLPPSEGQKPVLTRISFYQNNGLGRGFEFRWRPAYYDLISLETARLPNSSLSIFDFKFASTEKKVFLKQLDLIGIESLNISSTGLPGDGDFAWKFRTGIENQDLSCTDCMVFQIEGGYGKAYQIISSVALYGLLDLRLQTPAIGSGTVALAPQLGALIEMNSSWKIHTLYSYRTYYNGSESKYPILSVQNRFGNSRTWDIRLSYEEQINQEFKISYSRYW